MAPSVRLSEPANLAARAIYCQNGYYYSGGSCYANSGWYYWGRWVLAGVIILVFIALLFGLGCVNSRRRRKRGMSPLYGTGWMAPQNKFGAYGQNNPGAYQPPPPQYSASAANPQNPQYTGQTYNSNEGYYGNQQQTGVNAPNNTYYPRGGDDVYQPPAGPPPGKVA